MIKVLHEAFKNLPSWITSKLDKYELSRLDKKGIDLYNCTYEEADDLKMRDSRWTDSNLIPVFLLNDERYGEKLYIWNIIDPYMADGKNASKHNRQWLLDNSIHKGFINISANKKAQKDRYIDPRNDKAYRDKHQKYAGQRSYKNSDGSTTYYTNTNRDKSGYVIPNPADKLKKLYEFDLDNYADVLERYYKKINSLKKKLFDIDFRAGETDLFAGKNSYNGALRKLGDVVDDYKSLSSDIDRIVKRFNELPEEQRTSEMFKDRIGWVDYSKSINNNIIELQEYIRKLEEGIQ